MRVLLRNTQTGLYYARRYRWVAEPSRALDLGDIERASRFALEENVTPVEVILSYNNPICQLALPVRLEWLGGKAGRAAA
jgi:hypothetical protein